MKFKDEAVKFLLLFFINLQICFASNFEMTLNPSERFANENPNYQREYVSHYENQNAYTNFAVVQKSVLNSIKLFNTWFKVDIQTTGQLIEVASILIADYYNKLRICQPGVYRYPVPNVLFGWRINNEIEPKYFLATSRILGIQSGYCVVDTSTQMRQQISRVYCAFSGRTLNYFTDQKAFKDARNNLSYQKNDLTELQLLLRECKAVPIAVTPATAAPAT